MLFYLSLLETEEEQSKFRQLYEQYYRLMLYRAREILYDDQLAEDAVEEAFLKIIKNFNKIGDVKSNKTKHFIVIVVESAAKDIWRKEKKHHHESWEVLEERYCDQLAEQINEPTTIEKAILSLPLTYQQVFHLKYGLGYDNKEIARMLGIKEGTLRQRIARGKVLLQERLDEMGVADNE